MTVTNATGDDSTDVRTPECGHAENARQHGTVAMPGLGDLCRPCYARGLLERWPDTLRKTRVNHHTGETSHPRTSLVGADNRARLIYLDEVNRRLIRVVPKHHPDHRHETTSDNRILRHYPKRHDPRTPSPVNAPDGDVIAIVAREDVEADYWMKRGLYEWLVEQGADAFAGLSEEVIEGLRRSGIDGADELVDALGNEYKLE